VAPVHSTRTLRTTYKRGPDTPLLKLALKWWI